MTGVPLPIDFPPGISRDGTLLDAQTAVDAQWCRWRKAGGPVARSRKMGGFIRVTNVLKGQARKIHVFYQGATAIVHIGTTAGIQQVVIDYNGNFISSADRTPAAGFTPGLTVGWTLDAIFDTQTSLVQLIAHSVPDTGFPTSITQSVPFIGSITATAPLMPFSTPPSGLGGGTYVQPSIAGGVVSVQPYAMAFDANGLVQWSAPNIPLTLGVSQGTTGAGQARISAQKIMSGYPLRGGGAQQPAVIFWSLSEVITGSFVGSAAGTFAFSTASPSSSILSTDAVVEYDGLYYWPGIDRFLVFNGTVTEVPNPYNQDWFYNNLNFPYSGKVYGFKVPRFGEIWWLAPMFGNTECSHAIIFNVRENCWYDTILPNGGRSTGFTAQGLRYPLMTGTVPDATGYKLWTHENGVDENDNGTLAAIRSYFETPLLGAAKMQPPTDKGLSVQQLEPDFIQSGDMSVSIIGQANPKAPVSTGTSELIRAVPLVSQEQFTSFKEAHRYVRLHIESNALGGNYIGGKNLLHVMPSDARLTG